MADVDKLVDKVSAELYDKKQIPSYDKLLEIIRIQAMFLVAVHGGESFSEDELAQAAAKIQTRHDTTMGLGVLFEAETYTPWLADKRGEIDFYYWERYKQLLQEKMAGDVVLKIDNITDKIVDHLEDPHKDGSWERRGLVVGHVQSGKTANYIGVMCKAADAGYKVIIVLGGLLNSLRDQTQKRIDSDFFGFCTKSKKEIGVAKFDNSRRPFSLTTSVEDFRKTTADRVQIDLNALNEPVVLVLKKNVTTLKNLRNWLAASNKRGLSNYPMLLIDDEADHASINTNKSDRNPTKINQGIRELLKMFPRNSYLGYTATPFANIFIGPENEHEMQDGEMYRDLFPRDFILSLDPPSNYVGPTTVFDDESETKVLREINDNEDLLPIIHDKDFVPHALPASLRKAINCFLLIKTIRELDGQKNKHHSMMINVSRFTDVQEQLKLLVSEYLKKYQQAIKNYAGLPVADALEESALLRELKTVWEEEFLSFDKGWSKRCFSWEEVQHQLNTSVSSIAVLSINNKSTDRLDYDDYPDGRSIIAVGGLGLSRGLTLEGLSVSYFLRNSIMYDTLLQMGRWFGYREGYKELCRIFMTGKAASWYGHISSAVEELREEFREMERIGLTPLEFGLKVRSHPTALLVTARNKMRDAEEFVSQIALAGRAAETSRLINDEEVFLDNKAVFENAIKTAIAEKNGATPVDPLGLGYLWKGVSLDIMEKLVSDFKNAPDCLLTTKAPLLEYISWLRTEKKIDKCDILLRTIEYDPQKVIERAGLSFTPMSRSLENQDLNGKRLTFIKRHVISRGRDEAAGLDREEFNQIKANYGEGDIPDKEFRKFKKDKNRPPLLILYFVKVFASKQIITAEGKKRRTPLGEGKTVPAYAISFPGDPSGNRRPEKTVTYTVNRVWLNENSEWQDDTDDMEEDEQ
ncbi:MAG: Z1 domain-containing protein [Lentisphaeria bacterium]|nr:Z1 domain-containing protein [Lentisphaeria bacterium]